MKEIQLYIEKYYRWSNTIIADFLNTAELSMFMQEIMEIDDFSINMPSEIYITNYEGKKFGHLSEGRIYSISLSFLKEHISWDRNYTKSICFMDKGWQGFSGKINDAPYSGRTNPFSQTEDDNNDSNFSPITSNDSKEKYLSKTSHSKAVFKGVESVTIKDVGQGNTNIVNLQEERIIFDLGCTPNKGHAFAEEKLKNISTSGYWLIISHWDIDHYNMLTIADDDRIKDFYKISTPELCGKTSLTSKKVLNRINNLSYNVEIISSPDKTRGFTHLQPYLSGNTWSLLVGEKHNNKNLSGLALMVWGNEKVIFLTADHAWPQLFESFDVFWNLNQSGENGKILKSDSSIDIVVPHHGGRARHIRKPPFLNFNTDTKGNKNKNIHNNLAKISVGKNNLYHHPLQDELAYIKYNLGFPTKITYEESDITLILS